VSKISCRLLSWLDDGHGQEKGRCFIWRSLFEGDCCCQVVTQRWVIFWWMKTERSDLEDKILELMRGRFVAVWAREWTVSLILYPFMAGDPNKNYVVRGRRIKFGCVRLLDGERGYSIVRLGLTGNPWL